MNICMITLSHKGIIHYSSQLCNAISRINSLTSIVTAEIADDYLFDRNVVLYRVPWPHRILSPKSLRFDVLVRHMMNIKPDVIHITLPHPWIIPSMLFFKLQRIAVVGTLHDVKNHPGDWSPFLMGLSMEFLKRTSDILIVHGTSLKKDLVKSGVSENKIKVIPHGDYEFFTEFKKKDLNETKSILFFGRILKYKGLEYLLGAIPLILKECPDAKFVIAGEGDMSAYGEMIEKLRPCLEIHNIFIADRNVADFFQKTRLVVLPYTEASQSGIIHIAYAFKKPVVATNIGAMPEIIEHGKTGLIVPPRDINALAEAIIRLLKDDALRKEMGEKAYKKMKVEMSWDKIAEKTIEVYKEAIELHKTLE